MDMARHQAPLADELKRALCAVVDSGAYILGPPVAELERQLAAYLDVPHAVGVSSGTDALLVSLMALGVGAGDAVLIPTYSFFATAEAVVRVGARPVFVDVDPGTGNLDVAAAIAHLDRPGGPPIKAVIPVHLFGQCADLGPLLTASARAGVAVIEDAAQAIGSRHAPPGSQRAGSVGSVGCFSFFPSKNLGGVGDGGLVVTPDGALAERLRVLRLHGSRPKHHHAVIGGNFRLDSLQAAALLVKLPHLDGWHEARRGHAARYDAALAELPGIEPLALRVPRSHHTYNQYVVRVPERRDQLQRHLAARGIASEIYYPLPFHLQPCFAHLGHRAGEFPHSERLAGESLALPVFAELDADRQDHVIEALRAFR